MITSFKQSLLSGKFLFNKTLAIILWFGLSAVSVIQILTKAAGNANNYIIYKYSFIHITHHLNPYLLYPKDHWDIFLYGPIFTVFIAPFALLPDWLGIIFWAFCNAFILYFAIRKLPIKAAYQNAILILSANEIMNLTSYLQFNAAIAACIILGFVYVHKNKEWLAVVFILFATFTKLYGIVGFAFFFFSKNKIKFIGWTIIWSVVFYLLPIIITSYSFLQQNYLFWFDGLIAKSKSNAILCNSDSLQDLSIMGLIKRNIYSNFKADKLVIITGAVLVLSTYLRIQFLKDIRFQIYSLCLLLITVVIFSTGAEPPTFIIAFVACSLWFVVQPPSKFANAIFIFCLIGVSFSHSDLVTSYGKQFSIHHAIKALPCLVLWIIILFQIHTKQFLNVDLENGLRAKK